MENPTAEKILWDSMEPDTTDWLQLWAKLISQVFVTAFQISANTAPALQRPSFKMGTKAIPNIMKSS